MGKEKIINNLQNEFKGDPEELSIFLQKFDILMMRYDSAIREIRTKLEILNDELLITANQNPILSIHSRRKNTSSIIDKLGKLNKPVTLKHIIDNLNDVAGVRVICSFIDDIYKVVKMISHQDDIKVIEIKDYIKNPKPNGYRSLHMIVEIPVFFSKVKQMMRVEIQIRTVAMDFWASLEHQMKYKQEINNAEMIRQELKECAETISSTDRRMLEIRNKIHELEQAVNLNTD